MKAVILAAGKGSRLAPLTDITPKPLIPIRTLNNQNETILDMIVKNLPEEIDEVIVVVSHLADRIESHIKDVLSPLYPHIVFKTVHQLPESKGTLSALKSAQQYFSSQESFIVMNGDDVISTEDLKDLIKHTRAFGIKKKVMLGYNIIEINSEGNISGMRRRNENEKDAEVWTATGAYCLDSAFFELEPVMTLDGEYGIPQTLIAHCATYKIKAVDMPSWIHINTKEELESARLHFSTKP